MGHEVNAVIAQWTFPVLSLPLFSLLSAFAHILTHICSIIQDVNKPAVTKLWWATYNINTRSHNYE